MASYGGGPAGRAGGVGVKRTRPGLPRATRADRNTSRARRDTATTAPGLDVGHPFALVGRGQPEPRVGHGVLGVGLGAEQGVGGAQQPGPDARVLRRELVLPRP